VSIVNTAELHRMLRGLRQRHPPATALAEDALIANVVMIRLTAEFLGGDLLQPRLAFLRHRIRGPRHGVGGLAAAGDAGKRQIL
jgi:hypothetical protein